MSKLLTKILYFGLPVVLLAPLLLSKSFLYPFVTAKGYFIYIVVDFLLVLYILLVKFNSQLIPKSKIFYCFVGLTTLKFLLDIFGINFGNSFWGNYERMMGFYTWLHLLIFLVMLVTVYVKKEQYIWLLRVSLGVSLLVSIYGILQKLGFYFWLVIPGDERVYATLGNAAYLAGYLLLSLYLAVYLFLDTKDYRWRLFYTSAFILNLMVLFFTATRGALVGLFASIFLMLFYCILFFPVKKIRIILIATAVLVIIAISSIFLFKDSSFVKNNSTLVRFSDISLNSGTVKYRILLWQSGISAARDRWLLGYGENNLRVPLDKYYDVSMVEDWADSSHNQFIDELLAHGLVGLVTYISFLFFVFWKLFQYRKTDVRVTIIFSGLVFAYVINNFFLFENLVALLSFVLVLGYLIVLESAEIAAIQRPSIFGSSKKWYIFVLAVIVAIFSFYINSRSINVMTKMVNAGRIIKENADTALILYADANSSSLMGFENIAAKLYGDTVLVLQDPAGLSKKQIGSLLEIVTKVTEKALKNTADNSFFYLNLGKIYQQAVSVDQSYLEKSFPLLEKAKNISPNRVDVYFAISHGLYMKGDYIGAEQVLYDSLKLGARLSTVYRNLAEVQMRRGDPKIGLANLKEVEKNGGTLSYLELEKFAGILVKRKEWQNLLDIFFWQDVIHPNDKDVYANIILTYRNLGDRANASVWEDRLKELNKIMPTK